MTDDELDIQLRPPDEVARRMVLLAAFTRWATAVSDDESDEREIAAEVHDIRDALTVGPFDADLSPSERELLRKGDLDEEDVLRLSWRIEALRALAWACGIEPELPPPWRVSQTTELVARIADPWEDLDELRARIELPDEESVAVERERAELWFWRAAMADELASAGPRERPHLEVSIRETADEAAEAGLLAARAGDFGVDRRPFAQLDMETVALIAEVAGQRLHALNWLCGHGDTWDNVPLDV